ncbi:MAG: hypothetical protein ACHQUC_01350 [Chlamydiales bacterium]
MSIASIKKLLIEDAAFYDAQMNEIKLNTWSESLQNIKPEEIRRAQLYFRSQPGRRQIPMPADIINFFIPALDDDSKARDAASRICSAIREFGYTNPEKAKTYIGELGWRVVERQGGWVRLCEEMHDDQLAIFQAQARDLAKAQIQFAKAGLLDSPPELPKLDSGRSMGELTSTKEIMNKLTIEKEIK